MAEPKATTDPDHMDETDPNKDGGLEGFEASAFEQLEKDFQEVLAELVEDKSLDKFRSEYEKIHHALKKSHEQEKKLVKKCRELNSEIVGNAAKVQTALKLSQEDQTTIASLKKEIEKAWKMVDASHEKEMRAKDTIQQLKEEIANLGKLVEHGAGLSIGQEQTLNELMKVRDDLLRKNDEQMKTINEQTNNAARLVEQIHEMERIKAAKDSEIGELHEELAVKNAEQEREQRRKERLDKELKDLKQKLEQRQTDMNSLNTDLETSKDHESKLESQLKEARNMMDKYLRDYDVLYTKTQKLTDDMDDQIHHSAKLFAENNSKEEQLKKKSIEISRLENEITINNRMRDKDRKENEAVRSRLDEVKRQLIAQQNTVAHLNKEVELWKKAEEEARKQVTSIQRTAELHQKAVARETAKTKVALDQVVVNERTTKNLESEIYAFKQEASKQRKLIYQLEKDREKYGIEASEASAKFVQAMEEVKLKEMQVTELQKKVGEGDAKLKQQQQLYEAVRADRNLYSKNLIEAQDEISEMKRKFKIMNHQIEQLKEEITAKDHALVKEHFDHQKVDKQKEQLKNELSKMKKLLESNELTINSQNAEILKLTHMIQKMDDEALRQRKEYDQVINERDILGTQLIRRNDELALVYEKIKIQQSALRKGEAQYQERIEDLRVLKLKIVDQRRELRISNQQYGQLTSLKREVYHLQRELLQEKTKVKALSEELENPMNVHRWRKLEGSDPSTYEMIQKLQTLQKRLIAKTEEVVEKDIVIQEKEALYTELKTILSRQPGPEVAEQLTMYQQSLKEKTKQMKAMASELNMYQVQMVENKFELDKLNRELQDTKRKYYTQKRKEQLLREQAANGNALVGVQPRKDQLAEQRAAANAATSRFAGGGFNLTSSSA